MDGVGLGGGVDEVAYGGEAEAGVGAVLGAADEVAGEGGEGGEGGGAVLGGDVACGDLGVGEGEDALEEGQVGFVREVGARGFEVGGGGEFAVADHVAGGVPDDGAGEGVGNAGEAVQDGVPGVGVEPDLGVGEVVVVEDDEGGAAAGAGGGGVAFVGAVVGGVLLGDADVEAVAQDEPVGTGLGVDGVVVRADGDAVGAGAVVVDGEGPGGVGLGEVGVRVSTPVVRSHWSAQAWTSRSVAEARLSMKSARVALPNLWRAKWVLMPARKSFSPSQATSWRRAEAPLA